MANDLASRFEQEMLARYQAWKEFGYVANRFLMAVRNRGGVGAAKYLLSKKGVSPGLQRLAAEGRTDLSVEALVLSESWRHLFTAKELAAASNALKSCEVPS